MYQNLKEKLKKEMNSKGYICDSDNTERFLDEIILDEIMDHNDKYDEKEFDEIEYTLRRWLHKNYQAVGLCDDRGDYIGYFYDDQKYVFENVSDLEAQFNLQE
jgi:hypothetical protein